MNISTQLKRLGATDAMIAGALVDGKPIADFARTTSNTATAGRFDEPGRIRLVVPGPAPGKPRQTRRDKWAKRPCVVRYREWCDLVRSIAGVVPAAERVAELRIAAFFEPPKSWPKSKRARWVGTRHENTPDADNLCKAAMDTLWPDNDSAISDVSIRKRWDWHARLEIEIVLEETQ